MSARVSSITAFRLTTARLESLTRFYEGLGFAAGDPAIIGEDEMALWGLERGGTRMPLRLGGQRLDLDSFDVPGRPYPPGGTAADLCFQHFAIVTDDAEIAWQRVRSLGAVPISSSGPVRLPPETGVAAAVKFRDPEGHPLELVQFAYASGRSWTGTHLYGIDHSAISVSDVSASQRFYESLGLTVRGRTLNQGPTQMVLDGLADAVVDVVPMLPHRDTPHLELLGYRTPAGRVTDRLEANDIAGTRLVWEADRDELIRDPDGHLHLLRHGQPVA